MTLVCIRIVADQWGQDFHDLLLQSNIGLRKIFLCPCTPFGEQGVEEIKGQTFSKHYFDPRIDELLHSRPLHQSVRESSVGLVRCTGSGDVTVHLDNFTFLLPLCDTSFQSRTGNLVLDLHWVNLHYTTLTTSVPVLHRSVVQCMSSSSKPFEAHGISPFSWRGISSVPDRLKILKEKIQVTPMDQYQVSYDFRSSVSFVSSRVQTWVRMGGTGIVWSQKWYLSCHTHLDTLVSRTNGD